MSDVLALCREALAGERVWLVGGAVRDAVLGRETADIDLVVAGDARAVARALGRAARAATFELSDDFGAWRVVDRAGAWRIDVNPLRGDSLEEDLSLRDFTVNAIAQPLSGGDLVDPLGGLGDLRQGTLRVVSDHAFADDPLRVLRLVRLSVAFGMQADAATQAAAVAQAPRLRDVAAERVFTELCGVLAADEVVRGVTMMDELGVSAAVLPELAALHGVAQNRFHHRDVYGHTLEALAAAVQLQRDPAAILGAQHADAVAAFLREGLADELTRGTGLRLAVLLHDVAKPLTQTTLPDGRVAFPGHDAEGARVVRAILTRLRASERLRAHTADMTRHHLRLGFLVAERPLGRRAVYGYLRACAPVQVDVTLLSVADRLATRGDRATEAIDAHLGVARELLGPALAWHAGGPPATLVRGDELALELGLVPGPQLGVLLEELRAAQYAGEVGTRDQALAHARATLAADSGGPRQG